MIKVLCSDALPQPPSHPQPHPRDPEIRRVQPPPPSSLRHSTEFSKARFFYFLKKRGKRGQA